MADDPPSAGAPDAGVAPDAIPDPRFDRNSRIERRVWLLLKDGDRAEARAGVKFGQRQFRVYVNGGLLWSRNYALDDTTQFDADAATKRAEFVALGWEPPGDPPAGT